MSFIKMMNEADFKAFPQKANPKRVTSSFVDTDGKRYFLTRVSTGVGPDGKAKYAWAKGQEMRQLGQNA
jgi:hypothetical protein